jgi:hypothetical protein
MFVVNDRKEIPSSDSWIEIMKSDSVISTIAFFPFFFGAFLKNGSVSLNQNPHD